MAAELDVPPEVLDPDTPSVRRHHLAVAWALENEVTRDRYPDLRRLRELGLLPPVLSQRELYARFLT